MKCPKCKSEWIEVTPHPTFKRKVECVICGLHAYGWSKEDAYAELLYEHGHIKYVNQYTVTLRDHEWVCNCKGYYFRKKCKHTGG